MPHAFASLLTHAIFSTHKREPTLTPELVGRLFPYMGGIVRDLKGTALVINGPVDHVHLLLSLPTSLSIAELVRVLKANSSRWVHEQFPERRLFGWQAGYAAFTVSNSRLEPVRQYIAAQQEHHRKVTFQEEFVSFLKKHGLAYDEKELWA
jgi:REP element-mobilizing transposase RayT